MCARGGESCGGSGARSFVRPAPLSLTAPALFRPSGGAIPQATPVIGVTKATTQVSKGGGVGGIDTGLAVYFFFWYLGNYYYNIVNKLALKAAGGECGTCVRGR